MFTNRPGVTGCAWLLLAGWATAQAPLTADTTSPDPAIEKRFEQFAEMLGGRALVGHFTVEGQPDEGRREERYEIRRVEKLPQGDYWTFHARITYADHDVTVPVPLQVKWAGGTPVITVDNITIPGLGTFDARVLIADDKYAGTWRHGDAGGLMFGRIEPLTP
jgi:hypothetical protein